MVDLFVRILIILLKNVRSFSLHYLSVVIDLLFSSSPSLNRKVKKAIIVKQLVIDTEREHRLNPIPIEIKSQTDEDTFLSRSSMLYDAFYQLVRFSPHINTQNNTKLVLLSI